MNKVICDRPLVTVFHPRKQHAYETAMAAQQAKMLQYFVTGVYFKEHKLPSSLIRWLPSAWQTRLRRELHKRWHPELDGNRVISVPQFEIGVRGWNTFAQKLRLNRYEFRWLTDTWWCDRWIARWLSRLPHKPNIVHGFEGGALDTFRTAKRFDITTVLDVPSAHEYFIQLVGEEHSRVRLSKPQHLSSPKMTERVLKERELADYLFAASDFVMQCLVDNSVPAKKIVKIPYGVNVDQFKPWVKRESDGIFRVLFVGRIDLRKGIRYLLQAWQELNLPKAQLIMIGAPDTAGSQILKAYNGAYRLIGLLPHYEIPHYFQTADVFVLPSLAEGSALVSYEAMAAGLPLIVTENCGAVTRDEVDGFVIRPRDVQMLKKKILWFYEHPEVRRQMGESARRFIEKHYTWGHYRRRVAAAYQAVADGKSPQEAVDLVDSSFV